MPALAEALVEVEARAAVVVVRRCAGLGWEVCRAGRSCGVAGEGNRVGRFLGVGFRRVGVRVLRVGKLLRCVSGWFYGGYWEGGRGKWDK